MNDKEINEMNVDDYIRQQKRKGKKSIRWGKNGWSKLRILFVAHSPCIHGWFCLCSSSNTKWMNKNFKSGMIYMGIKHYRK